MSSSDNSNSTPALYDNKDSEATVVVKLSKRRLSGEEAVANDYPQRKKGKTMSDTNGNGTNGAATNKMDIDSPAPEVEQLKQAQQTGNGEIDESLYSRQLYVLGHEAMKRMGSSHVLVVGTRGLGVEIAKNIALAGVKSLTIWDPKKARIEDLSSQFFLHPSDVGKPRAEVTAPRVSELNPYTPVSVHQSSSLTDNLSQLKKYQAVVLTDHEPVAILADMAYNPQR
ncbi:E1 ubiquitin-activating protein [Recurvomyces mirabilis]|nr:E1 ubiquitin-activating protein [Recurvomyces mirabilis]